MIDLHLHSLLSDGELLPSELARRMEVKGYRFIAITDHVDMSNISYVVPNLVRACEKINSVWRIKVIPGMEITHTPLKLIGDLAVEGRKLGAKLIIVHGETLAEPVRKGMNRAALLSDIDILAHPGLISEEDARLARKKNIYIEISGRKGHSFSNGHVVRVAKKVKARLTIDSDSHMVEDLMDIEMRKKVGLGAGLSEDEIEDIDKDTCQFARRVLRHD